MIQLTNRTEFSFRVAAGKIEKIIDMQKGNSAIGICDRHGTWGHPPFAKACKEAGVKPIFGVELACVLDCNLRDKQKANHIKLLAANNEGLKEIYEVVSLATEKFYYTPRIDWGVVGALSENVVVLLGSNPEWDQLNPERENDYFELNQMTTPRHLAEAKKRDYIMIANSDNIFPVPEDLEMYEMVMGKFANDRTCHPHILSEFELRDLFPDEDIAGAILNSEALADALCAELNQAQMVIPEKPETLLKMCQDGAVRRGCDLQDPVYSKRLERELELIDEKGFEDYFYVVADLVDYAKQHMLVGPARGSSCGSLVCWLIGITDIDPIPYGLIFERFIDINRSDYPDIDIDFADSKREMVFTYLQNKYGHECVAKLGTVSLFKAKSAITDVAKAMGIPKWEVDELKNSIIERSGGDARANLCVMDTFEETDIGKKTLAKHPELAASALIEGHARHTGVHAAGIIVTNDAITNYCSIDEQNGVAMLDKHDAERLDLLKIDVLGLRTLSVVQDCIDAVGMTKDQLDSWPMDDAEAFQVLSDHKFSGIFQFEGQALQQIVKQMDIREFEDIVAVTALARPGPLASGGTSTWVARKMGHEKVQYANAEMKEHTQLTYGVVIYQEQVMNIARGIGKLNWEDTSQLRKAMSKSMGKEFFDRYWEKFKIGAMSIGMEEETARDLWDNINTMGSWAFNRSHAVAYGMMSYWCCILKAHHPLEWAAACLRHAKDDDQSIKILRELIEEGYEYVAKSPESGLEWKAHGKVLVGPLAGIKGIGPKLAMDIVKRREAGNLTPRQRRLLEEGVTPWDTVYPCRDFWGHITESPHEYNIASKLITLDQLEEDTEGTFVFIAKLLTRNTRDANEPHYLEKRGGKRMTGQTKHLNIMVEDDTGSIMIQFNRFNFNRWGKALIEDCNIGDWFIFKGDMSKGIRIVWGERWVKITDNEKYLKKVVDV